MSYLEWANSKRQSKREAYQNLAGGGNGKSQVNEYRVSVWDGKRFWAWMVVMVHNSVNVINATKLPT